MELDNELINQFLTGTVTVFVLVLIGGALANIFRAISRKFLFTKSALILALPPFCLVQCLDQGSRSTLYLYAIVLITLGFLIDGTRHLLFALRDDDPNATSGAALTDQSQSAEQRVVWDKAD